MPIQPAILAAVLLAAWLAVVLVPRPLRRAFVDGLRCMVRYPDLWKIPTLFGLAYAVFNLAVALIDTMRAEVGLLTRWQFDELSPLPPPGEVAASSILPAAENLGGIFTSFTVTFPLSALLGTLFLLNRGGFLAETARALTRRFGRLAAWLVCLGLALSAIAAIVKPALFLFLPELSQYLAYRALLLTGATVNALSFVFEFLLGTCFQVYFMLMALAWVRGMRFDRARLMRLAIRRLAFVIKWSLCLIGLALVGVHLPLAIEGVFVAGQNPAWTRFWGLFADTGRVLFVAIVLLLAPVQLQLVFHNESLRHAIADAFRFARQNFLTLPLFLLAAGCPFLLVQSAFVTVERSLGAESLGGDAASIIRPFLVAWLSGWITAAWVCFFRRQSSPSRQTIF
jgi:hypothetical protein